MIHEEIFEQYVLVHSNYWNRKFHKLGLIMGAFWICITLAFHLSLVFLLVAIPITYGVNWMGHFLFEKNQPLTFKKPFQSFLSFWVMVFMTETKYQKTLANILQKRKKSQTASQEIKDSEPVLSV